ncbi:unnamed protein product [Rotaria sp. Silwood1]|nr:unnamed protein product [Rotaria sp. Silwood1]CAF1587017.1 unnamed protein product [Rotaria sp. Silwood1]
MDQHLSNVNLQIVDRTNKDETVLSPESIVSGNGKESINLFLSMKTLANTTIHPTQYDTNNQILNSEKLLIKQIQNYLLLLTKSDEVTKINTKVNNILIKNGFVPTDHYQKAIQEMKAIFDKQQQLQKSLRKKVDADNNNDRSIFAEPCIESSMKDKNISPIETTTSIHSAQKSTMTQEKIEIEAQQFSYFTIQLLTSLLLVSIKANERVDPSITLQIIILASQLCEQIPIKYLSSFELSSNSNSLMFKSLKPLTNYINELFLSTDPILATQAAQILLKFSIAQASFKDLLPIISKLILNTTDIYNVRYLFLQLNNCLTETINQFELEKQQLDNGPQDDSNYREDKENDTISKKTTG